MLFLAAGRQVLKACAFKFKLMLLTLIVFVTTRNGLMNISDYAVIFREQAQRITPCLCVNPCSVIVEVLLRLEENRSVLTGSVA